MGGKETEFLYTVVFDRYTWLANLTTRFPVCKKVMLFCIHWGCIAFNLIFYLQQDLQCIPRVEPDTPEESGSGSGSSNTSSNTSTTTGE